MKHNSIYLAAPGNIDHRWQAIAGRPPCGVRHRKKLLTTAIGSAKNHELQANAYPIEAGQEEADKDEAEAGHADALRLSREKPE